MEGIRPLSPDRPRRSLIIDDIPVPSPKKDFNALLEERLKDSANAVTTEEKKGNKKFPFLKKGQGLARYRPNPDNAQKRIRSRSTTLPSSRKIYSSQQSKTPQPTFAKPKDPVKITRRSEPLMRRPSSAPQPKQMAPKQNFAQSVNQKKRRTSAGGVVQLKLQENNNKELMNASSDQNSSDLETKTRRELEEVRIFEMMEEKAENSSFCSNSSAVLAFLHQSSPAKSKFFLQKLSSEKQSGNGLNNDLRQEIVCTTTQTNYVSSLGISQLAQAKDGSDEDIRVKWENFAACSRRELQNTEKSNSQEAVGALQFGLRANENYDSKMELENETQDEANISHHVRFAEFNEYKTIGLSDVSTISTESRVEKNYTTNGAWSDCSVTDSSDTETKLETLYVNKKFNGSLRKNLVKQFCEERESMENGNDDSSDTEESDTAEDSDDSESIEDEEYVSKDSQDETIIDNETDVYVIKNSNPQKENDCQTMFNSALLKTRLQELEREIEVYRQENSSLKFLREQLQLKHNELEKLIVDQEKYAKAEKVRIENYLIEEKKKLSREKAALDNRLKDAREKSLKSRQERDEIVSLKHKLDELKDEMYQKESKWQAAQARHKSQVRVLMTQNSKLKEEIERLEKLRSVPKVKKPATKTNTRAIHQINRLLQNDRKSCNKNSSSDEEDIPQSGTRTETVSEVQSKIVFDVEKQRNLYRNLLTEATIGIVESEEAKRNAEELLKTLKDPKSMPESNISNSNNTENNTDRTKDLNNYQNSRFALNLSRDADTSEKIQKKIMKSVKEVREVDGHIEHWYNNGNVMKIFPDKNLKKLIYYNGDVRESDATGKVKYFYASSRTWHTTNPDGTHIFEYPDGKVETRDKDGRINISYPDGTVRIWEANGSEKWALPDGTVGETLSDGNKIFNFANGQREIHTKDHRKREYPDGTVKIVYSDGTQETRYANGRVRLKDKDGNLIMDSH